MSARTECGGAIARGSASRASARVAACATVLLACAAAGAIGAPPFACLALATLAWLAAIPSARRASPLLVLAVAFGGRALLAPSAYRTDDLYRYAWEGRVLDEGLSPYELAPDAPELAYLRDASWERINHREHAAIYPPGALLAFRAMTSIGLREEGIRALLLALDALTVVALLLWLRAAGKPAGWAILYAWSPLAALASASGHLEALALLPLACAGIAWTRGKWTSAAALVALAASMKLFALLALPWMLLRRPRAVLAGFVPIALLALAPFLGGANPFGPLAHFGSAFAFNGSLFELAERIAPNAARALCGVALVLALLAIARSRCGFAGACALSSGALLLLSPTVHWWYLTWALLPLAAIGPRRASAPFLAWCASSLALYPTYASAYFGAEFLEREWSARVEYAIPLAVLVWALFGRRAHREALAPPRMRAHAPGSFAVVIPCRNEAANLRELLPRWLATDAARVVVADTPSGDRTRALCAFDERIRYVEVARRGYGAALFAGFEAAGPVDFFVVSDADHAEGPEHVRALLAPFVDPRVGLVSASRPRSARLTRAQRLGNAFVCALIGRATGRRFHDLGAFRALRRVDWPPGSLVDAGYGIHVETNLRALQRGIAVVELELPRAPRARGEDRISRTWRGVLRAGRGMLARFATTLGDPPRASAVLLVKVPPALPVKTRLARELGEARARELHLEMLRETLGRARAIDAEPTLAFSPPDADAERELGTLGACRRLALRAEGGAACLEEALARSFDGRPLVALGADSPDLPLALLFEAVRAAERGDAALVPTPDGGFACLALPRPVPGLAGAFAFGARDACGAIERHLAARGLRVVRLAPWPDVDTVLDLRAWWERSGRGASDPNARIPRSAPLASSPHA